MKHTQGKWTLENTTGNTLRITAGPRGFVITEVTNDCITHFIGNTEEALANAKLIAAAPELLAVLKRLIEYSRYPTIPANFGAIKESVDAIKKATE